MSERGKRLEAAAEEHEKKTQRNKLHDRAESLSSRMQSEIDLVWTDPNVLLSQGERERMANVSHAPIDIGIKCEAGVTGPTTLNSKDDFFIETVAIQLREQYLQWQLSKRVACDAPNGANPLTSDRVHVKESLNLDTTAGAAPLLGKSASDSDIGLVRPQGHGNEGYNVDVVGIENDRLKGTSVEEYDALKKLKVTGAEEGVAKGTVVSAAPAGNGIPGTVPDRPDLEETSSGFAQEPTLLETETCRNLLERGACHWNKRELRRAFAPWKTQGHDYYLMELGILHANEQSFGRTLVQWSMFSFQTCRQHLNTARAEEHYNLSSRFHNSLCDAFEMWKQVAYEWAMEWEQMREKAVVQWEQMNHARGLARLLIHVVQGALTLSLIYRPVIDL